MGKTRLFKLKWNYAGNPKLNSADRFRERNTVGVHFHTGLIALSSGSGYNSIDEMKRMIKHHGKFEVEYLDDASIEIAEDDHAQAS